MPASARQTRTIEFTPSRYLVVDEWTCPDTPTVLFLHGNGLSRGIWRPIAEVIADSCHAVAIDNRGHGHSWKPRPPEPYRWTLIADELAEVIAHERWSPLVVCGHSLGGALAVDLAARYPTMVDALVLLEPALAEEPLGPETMPGILETAARRLRRRNGWKSVVEAASYFRARPPYDAWLPAAFEGYVDTAFTENADRTVLACPPSVEAAICTGGDSYTPFQQLRRLTCPTWLVQSAVAADGAPRTRHDKLDHLHGLRRTWSIGTSHFLPCERIDLPAQALREAIDTSARER